MSDRSLMSPFLHRAIDERLERADYTRADLARLAGVSRSTMKRRLDGAFPGYGRGGDDALVEHVAELLGIDPLVMWREALALWERDPSGRTVPAVIER